MDILPQAIVNGLLLASVYSIVALGLTLIFGVLDVVNFSHGQLITLGAYLIYELGSHRLPFWVAALLVVAGLFCVGAAMEVVTFRPVRQIPINGLIVSVGWIAIIGNVFTVAWGPDQYTAKPALSGHFHVGSVVVSWNQALLLVVSVVVM